MSYIIKAAQLAKKAHEGQIRKFSGEPYIVHPARVANIIILEVDYPTEYMLAATWMHDVIEDCAKEPIADLYKYFPKVITDLVEELTNEFDKESYPTLNRQQRKKLEFERISKISPVAQTIKLADRIDNVQDFIKQNELAQYYWDETHQLLEVCKQGNSKLYDRLERILYAAAMLGKVK